MTRLALPIALSVVALVLSGLAFHASQEPTPRLDRSEPVSVDRTQEIESLEESVRALGTRVALLEVQLADRSAETSLAAADESDSDDWGGDRPAPAEEFEERVAAAVDEVMEAKAEDFVRRARQKDARRGMTKWATSQQQRLPVLRDLISSRLNVDRPRRQQVTEVVDATIANIGTIVELLNADPPPNEEDGYTLMGEMKESVGGMVSELDEILSDEELVELGELSMEAELHGIGKAMIAEGSPSEAESGGGQ
ncbi:MAG: hypothetical protein AAF488_03335 [Planctomycetota bacterium]